MLWPDRLATLEVASPWWAPYAAVGQVAAAGVLRGEVVWQSLNDAIQAAPQSAPMETPCPVRFVPQSRLPDGEAYEAFIYQTKQVPTRCGAHDFFNGLMWAHWPVTKSALNALQARDIAQNGVQKTRGPFRDALTLLDENGALLVAPRPIWDALVNRSWIEALVTLRPLWAQARLWVFGHALLEQLLLFPRKSLTAHLWLPTPAFQAAAHKDLPMHALDALWADALRTDVALAGKPFTPLPVMGIPGWDAANNDARFYSDAGVFRPLREGQKAPQRVSQMPVA